MAVRLRATFPKWKEPIYRLFAKPDQKLALLRANSHLRSSRELVQLAISREKFDFIMMDADHTYAGVKRDFKL